MSLLPELYNTRADKIWEQIDKIVDFTDKTVLDVGCGRGDLMMRAWQSGARAVYGIDNSKIEIKEARLRSWNMVKEGAMLFFVEKNVESWNNKWPGFHDIVICTSVLPYLIDPDKLLENISRDSDIAIIECQYAGDGPGFEYIEHDDDMKNWLHASGGWFSVLKIGSTDVESRPGVSRSIWMCSNV